MAQATPTITWAAYLGATWTSLNAYQVGDTVASWGIDGNGPIDLVARTGKLEFVLKNSTGLFTPGGSGVISADWKKTCPILLTISFESITRCWYGKIFDFAFEPDTQHIGERVRVMVRDWIDVAAKFPIGYPNIQFNKTSDQVAQTILSGMTLQPQENSLTTGTNTFVATFDTVTDFTKAMTELTKLALSEPAHLYITHRGSIGEKLIFENANSRSTVTLKTIPKSGADSGFLQMETDDYLLLEDGGKIILNEAEAYKSYNDALTYRISQGEKVINDIQFRYIPRETTTNPIGVEIINYTAVAVARVAIASGQTITITDKYYLPEIFPPSPNFLLAGKGRANTVLIQDITSVIYGALDMNAASDGSGTDLTADLQTISQTFRENEFTLQFKNNNVATGYLSFSLQLYPAGKGMVMRHDDVPVTVQDATSIAANDSHSINFDMPYQTDSTDGTTFANAILTQYKNPKALLNQIDEIANRNGKAMMAFLTLDVGDAIAAYVAGKISANYHVQNMSFRIRPGSIIEYSLGTKESSVAVTTPAIVGVATQFGEAVSSMSKAKTVGASANLLMVDISIRGSESISSVKFTDSGGTVNILSTGSAMKKSLGTTTSDPCVQRFWLVNPVAGAGTVDVVASSATFMEMAIYDISGVDTSSPFGAVVSDSGAGGTPSVTPSATGWDLVIDVIGVATGTITQGAGQTSEWNVSSDTHWRGGGSLEVGESPTMSWTLGGSNKWALLACAIKKG